MPRCVLDQIKKSIPFAHGVVLTTLPRGSLQVAQPGHLPPWFARTYADGVYLTDKLSWRSIQWRKPVAPGDCWSGNAFAGTPYARQLMEPLGVSHVVAFPLESPVLPGFPGSVHLLRTASQGAFTASHTRTAMAAVRAFDKETASCRATQKSGQHRLGGNHCPDRPGGSLIILDAKLRPQLDADEWRRSDAGLKEHILEHARRRMKQVDARGILVDRVQFPDSAGNVWMYRVVTYHQFPALKNGPVSFFLPLPGCREWIGIKPADFQADSELARLIPAFAFMHRNYRKSPGLVDIARVAKLSPFHFHRRFAELLGLTPKQFMLDCQIQEAKDRLLGGKIELADIARRCGFSHQSHFTSRFKQITGQTPTRWRRNNRV